MTSTDPIKYAEQIAYSTKDTLMFSYKMAVKYKDTPGVYCEAGVAAGAQIIVMAHGAPNKTIYAFDSFEGIPLPSNRDDQMPGIRVISEEERRALPNPGEQVLESSGATVVPIESVKQHIVDSGTSLQNIVFMKGWFEETVTGFTKPIAILRLDGDLYHSTWVCLKSLFPKVIKGGCVIIDDWQLTGCRAACEEYFESIGYKPDYKFISNIAYFYK